MFLDPTLTLIKQKQLFGGAQPPRASLAPSLDGRRRLEAKDTAARRRGWVHTTWQEAPQPLAMDRRAAYVGVLFEGPEPSFWLIFKENQEAYLGFSKIFNVNLEFIKNN